MPTKVSVSMTAFSVYTLRIFCIFWCIFMWLIFVVSQISRKFAASYLSLYMPKRSFSLTCKMREDLMGAYREVYTKCHSQKEAYLKTVNHPAPRFYVSAKQAYEMLRAMVVGDMTKIDALAPLKRCMYMELFEKLQQLSQEKAFIGKSLWFICPFLVTLPASQFYISAQTFKDIFPSMKKYGKKYHFRDTRPKRRAEKRRRKARR